LVGPAKNNTTLINTFHKQEYGLIPADRGKQHDLRWLISVASIGSVNVSGGHGWHEKILLVKVK
jgi:hypothetical protein